MDKFQQLKGVIGQQLAKAYLQQVRGCEIVGEELSVVGLDARAKLDIVVKDGNVYRPVEVKLQAYNHDWFGRAFEFIIDKIAEGVSPRAILSSEQIVPLEAPILLLWFPPSRKFRPERYMSVEVIQAGDALDALMKKDGDEGIEAIAAEVRRMTIAFLKEPNRLRLTPGQRKIWEKYFTH